MSLVREESSSLWQKEWHTPYAPALSSHQTADVCVIGAGIAGLSVAYELLRESRSVVVLERTAVGEGQTGLSSAHLSNVLDEGFVRLLSLHGEANTRLATRSHAMAIDEIERIARRENIDCDFRRVSGYLFQAPDASPWELERELEASRRAGFTEVEFLKRAPDSPFATGPCLRYPHQAEFHPVKYLAGLAEAIRRMGGKIFPHTAAESVEGGKPARVTTARGFQVVCGSIVVAANVPFNDRLTMHTKMAAYRTYVIGLRLSPSNHTPALYWDTEEPYHYLRLGRDEEGRILLVGGEDHRTGQPRENEDPYAQLQAWAADRLGIHAPVAYRWSGQVLEPNDGLAFIGRNPSDEKNVYIVTGDSGHGLTHGSLAGILLRDLILEHPNEWENIYDPSRVNIRSMQTYLRENVSSAAPYGDWVSPGDVRSIADIQAGEGAIVRDGLQKLAVYKDSFGRPHLLSAVCPHLGGIVRWNSAEKTWDCPCHGSRFECTGKVINGPAATGLKEVADTSISEGESVSA